MLGSAAIAMWWDITPGMQAEFEDWHTREHMPERLGIPGFRRGTRWITLAGEPSYFILYEAADIATITGGAYLERLNNPSPWSRKMMPHHLHMVRSLCHVRATSGAGVPHAMATVRFSHASGEPMPDVECKGAVTGVHLLEAQPMSGAQTTEQKIRGGDATAEWILLIGGLDPNAVRVAAKGLSLSKAVIDVFRLSYCLTPS